MTSVSAGHIVLREVGLDNIPKDVLDELHINILHDIKRYDIQTI